MQYRPILFGLVLLGLAALFGLAFGGCVTAERAEPPPDWLLDLPASDDKWEYFYAVGEDRNGDITRAEQAAVSNLIDSIVRYIGVRITVESSATARASLDSFESSVEQQVLQVGSARVDGFQIVDRYMESDANRVYLLARYDRMALEQERERLEALFYERVEAVDRPLRDGAERERDGDYIGAIISYFEAATAAATSEIENVDVKFEQSLIRIRDIMARFELDKLNDNLNANLGETLISPFIAQLTFGTSQQPVYSAPMLVGYKKPLPNGHIAVGTSSIKTDEKGEAQFEHPPLELIGAQTVTMWLDFSDYIDALQEVAPDRRNYIDELTDLIQNKRVLFNYSADSNFGDVPIGLAVLETDISGSQLESDHAAQGIAQELSRAGVLIKRVTLESQRYRDTSPETLEYLQGIFGQQLQYVVVGVVSLSEFEQLDDGILARVSGNFRVVRLADGIVLHSEGLSQRSRSSPTGAIESAFSNLGIKFAKQFLTLDLND